jgi:tetrahydromethanopterin S-methyltransferase subunit E
MGILFTILLGIPFTITMGFLFTITLGIQLTISNYTLQVTAKAGGRRQKFPWGGEIGHYNHQNALTKAKNRTFG